MRRCWRREEVQESQGPRVPRSRGPKVPGSKGPGYLKLTFKYELDSKEGPSCFQHSGYPCYLKYGMTKKPLGANPKFKQEYSWYIKFHSFILYMFLYIVDCILSDEPWSECKSGVMTTKKRVISSERNGGTCDNLMITSHCNKGPCQANTRTMDQDQDLILTNGFIVGTIIGSIVILVILIVMSVVIIYLCRRKSQTRVVVGKVLEPIEAYDNEDEADDDNEEDADAHNQQQSVPSQEDDTYADQDYTDYQDDDDDYENGPMDLLDLCILNCKIENIS